MVKTKWKADRYGKPRGEGPAWQDAVFDVLEKAVSQKHLIRMGVKASGERSFRLDTADILGAGKMMAVLRQECLP